MHSGVTFSTPAFSVAPFRPTFLSQLTTHRCREASIGLLPALHFNNKLIFPTTTNKLPRYLYLLQSTPILWNGNQYF